MYPNVRLRRLRKTAWMRDLVAEHILQPKDLIQPFFVIEGKNKKEPITTLPGQNRLTIDLLVEKAHHAESLGIKAIALFPNVAEELKNEEGTEGYNPNNLICRTIRALKESQINIGIISDVALDTYTSHRHDGILKNGDVHNDLTILALEKQALTLAEAGSDIIAPSDMMDGRIGAIRAILDEKDFHNVAICSYAMKYVSTLYGPFRDAVKSSIGGGKELNKYTYQADCRVGYRQARKEICLDIAEGADIVMIKPAMFYLDIITRIVDVSDNPVWAYQVGGEYSMIKNAVSQGIIKNYNDAMMEALTAIKRSGANAIFSYAAMEMASLITTKLS